MQIETKVRNVKLIFITTFRYAQKNNYPLLQHVTLPRIGAMKTIIDVVGPENDDDLNQAVTTPSNHHAKKEYTKAQQESDDQFYIDNEYQNQNNSTPSTPLASSPPTTPLKNAYNSSQNVVTQHNNNNEKRIIVGGIDDLENLKDKITGPENSAKKNLKYILDITIAYPDGEPLNLPNIVTGMRRACQTHLLYRLYRCSEVSRCHNHVYHFGV